MRAWLAELGYTTTGDLLAAAARQDTAATLFLLTHHRRGTQLATTLLLGAKAAMLRSVTRHAAGDTEDERFQVTVEAFLSRALTRVDITHKYLDQQLYWITLRTVTNAKSQHHDDANLTRSDASPTANPDAYLSVDTILRWAHNQKVRGRAVLSDDDLHALTLRYGREEWRSIRELASELRVTQDALESRVRRAENRLRRAVHLHRDDFDRFCATSTTAEDKTASAAEFGDAA